MLGAVVLALVPSLVGGIASGWGEFGSGGVCCADGSRAAGTFAQMTATPADPAAQVHSGTVTFGVGGMPDATFTSTKSVGDGQPTTVGPDPSVYVPADSPMGNAFGLVGGVGANQALMSTQIDAAAGTVVTTTVTFAAPVPAGVLGFALGASDASTVVVSGTMADSSDISGANLVGGTFNLCEATDAPPSCAGTSAPHPKPTWTAASRVVDGAGGASEGAVAWFRPDVSVKTLTFVFSDPSETTGHPMFRLWFTALTSTLTVHGTIPGVLPIPVVLGSEEYLGTRYNTTVVTLGSARTPVMFSPTDPDSWQLVSPSLPTYFWEPNSVDGQWWAYGPDLQFTHRYRVVPGVYELRASGGRGGDGELGGDGGRGGLLGVGFANPENRTLTGVRATRTSTGESFTVTSEYDGFADPLGYYPIIGAAPGEVFDLPYLPAPSGTSGASIRTTSTSAVVDLFTIENIDLRAGSVEIDLSLRVALAPGFTG